VIAASSHWLAGIVLLLVLVSGGCTPPSTVRARPVAASRPTATADVAQSIVIVDADGASVDMSAPWGAGKPWTETLTGVVVEGRGILVGGWGLRGQQHVQVQRPGATAKSTARIVVMDINCGLNLLTVDDEAFWTGLRPVAFASAPPRPTGARLLHATSDGSRVDVSATAIGPERMAGSCSWMHLKVLLDAKHAWRSDVVASASEVLGVIARVDNDEVLAVDAATLADFVAEAGRPPYRGYPQLGTPWQPLTNPALRQQLGLGPNDGGVRIAGVHSNGSAAGRLQVDDVLLSIGGVKVTAEGSCDDPKLGRIPFSAYALRGRHPGDVLQVEILRGGARQTLDMPLKAWLGSSDLIPWYAAAGDAGLYVVQGGLVFEDLSGDYLKTFGNDWETKAPRRLLDPYLLESLDPSPERPRLVVMTRVLADPATLGYQDLRDLIVESINGVHLRSIADVRAAFEHTDGGFDVVTFAPGQGVSRIVLDAQEARAADERLRGTYAPAR
jgi:hypothetical protein